jgi:site-specific recombinase XerC
LICTGQRVSDVTKMKREHYDGTHFALVQNKDRTKTPMKIKAPKLLQDILAARAKRVGDADYLLTHKWGRRYSEQSLSKRIKEVLHAIGHPEYTTPRAAQKRWDHAG